MTDEEMRQLYQSVRDGTVTVDQFIDVVTDYGSDRWQRGIDQAMEQQSLCSDLS